MGEEEVVAGKTSPFTGSVVRCGNPNVELAIVFSACAAVLHE